MAYSLSLCEIGHLAVALTLMASRYQGSNHAV
jgi:hypothetical protein